jgi:hypothetical protein
MLVTTGSGIEQSLVPYCSPLHASQYATPLRAEARRCRARRDPGQRAIGRPHDVLAARGVQRRSADARRERVHEADERRAPDHGTAGTLGEELEKARADETGLGVVGRHQTGERRAVLLTEVEPRAFVEVTYPVGQAREVLADLVDDGLAGRLDREALDHRTDRSLRCLGRDRVHLHHLVDVHPGQRTERGGAFVGGARGADGGEARGESENQFRLQGRYTTSASAAE